MNEFEDEIIEGLAKANITLNEIKIALKGFIAKMEALQPDLEYTRVEEELITPKKKRGAKKIEAGKVYEYHYKDGTEKRCKKCHGLISFDDYNKETHPYPTHVDEDGHMIGDGSCPKYDGGK